MILVTTQPIHIFTSNIRFDVLMITGEYPSPCEFDAITAAAIAACDPLDGLADGIILSSTNCTFDPSTMISQMYPCPSFNSSTTISPAAATVAK